MIMQTGYHSTRIIDKRNISFGIINSQTYRCKIKIVDSIGNTTYIEGQDICTITAAENLKYAGNSSNSIVRDLC